MNTDQPSYYANPAGPYPSIPGFFISNGMESQYSMGNPNLYPQGPRMHQPAYNGSIPSGYTQGSMFYASYPSFSPANGPRGVNPTPLPIVRPPNETANGSQTHIPHQGYSRFQSPSTIYSNQQYRPYPGYPTSAPNQSQYPGNNSQLSSQTPQQPLSDQQSTQSAQSRDKREKKPLAIVNPDSHQPVEVEKPPSSTNVSSSPTTGSVSEPTTADSRSEKQAKFRHDFAQLLHPNAPTENPTPLPTEDISSSSSSRSGSISKKPSEQLQPGLPGIRTGSITEDKPISPDSSEIEATLAPTEISPVESIENIAPAELMETTTPAKSMGNAAPVELMENTAPVQSIKNAAPAESMGNAAPAESMGNAALEDSESVILRETPSLSKRKGYTIEELRQKQLSLLSQERPIQLIEIPGVTSPAIPKHPVKPKIDGDKQFVRDVTSILNKLTPSNNDKLIQQLDELELNSAERLEGMITVMFVKAVEAAIFCSLYAKLCKHFQKKQVTVPDESGQPVTHYFRQILLTRCQREFEIDYRQDIDYDKRKAEVDAIEDEKTQKDADEQLEEDLLKAKRKKLGNIIFIGELFKLQMLTDTIMYDCILYLLRDKTDEESLECLCRLLRTMGEELDSKAVEKVQNQKSLEKNYAELNNIVIQRQTSTRIRFMIQDLLEMRKAKWVARREEIKPTTIDDIHETERMKREQQDIDRERDRQQRRDQNRMGGGGGSQHYSGSRGSGSRGSGSRGSGFRQQSSRVEDERNDNRVIVDSLRQYQSSEKRHQGQLPLNLAPRSPWSKGSGVEKKAEDDRSNTGRGNKPPAGYNPLLRSKTGGSPGASPYSGQRQPSRELARENSFRDRENAKESLRRATNTSLTNSREGSRNASREQSRNVSPDSSVNERVTTSNKTSTTESMATAPFDEEKTQARVHSLIEEYTENYSDSTDRPVNEALEDLESFSTANVNQQGMIVRELFTNVLEAKPRARKAVGHLLDAALHKNIFSTEGFLSGMKMFNEVVPDYAVDIPLIWQYIAEILGAFIGAPSSNMVLLKPILQSVSENKTKQLFRDIIRYAVEFSSQSQVQTFWQSAGFSLNDLFECDPSFLDGYSWLNDSVQSASKSKDSQIPRTDPQLVALFKSINDQGTTVSDDKIISFIHENMDPKEKYYTRNIVLSYLEACLINREPQKKIQENIAKERMSVLKSIIENQPEKEIQAVYAIQNFVHKLEHPPKMARLLFDVFYDEECVSEETFLEWLRQPDQSENDGHAMVGMSTQDFFTWLQQPDTEADENES